MANKGATGLALVDSSINSLSGSSQVLMAENQTRGALLIMNVGNANIGIKFAPMGSGTVDPVASIGSGGTYTIVPGGSYEPDGGYIPLNAIWVIGTAGQPVSACQSVNS